MPFPPRRSKYRATRMWECVDCRHMEAGGQWTRHKPARSCPACGSKATLCFASKKEHKRWHELRALEEAGIITDLRAQVPYDLAVDGHHITRYVADFRYQMPGQGIVVEDTKGYRTEEYKLKARLFAAVTGLSITEV